MEPFTNPSVCLKKAVIIGSKMSPTCFATVLDSEPKMSFCVIRWGMATNIRSVNLFCTLGRHCARYCKSSEALDATNSGTCERSVLIRPIIGGSSVSFGNTLDSETIVSFLVHVGIVSTVFDNGSSFGLRKQTISSQVGSPSSNS